MIYTEDEQRVMIEFGLEDGLDDQRMDLAVATRKNSSTGECLEEVFISVILMELKGFVNFEPKTLVHTQASSSLATSNPSIS